MRTQSRSRTGHGACLAGLLTLVQTGWTFADQSPSPGDVHFDRDTLRSLGLDVDVSAFERTPDALPAGTYQFILNLNGTSYGRQDIRITHTPEGRRQIYCFTREQLTNWGTAFEELPDDRQEALERDCVDLIALIPQAKLELDMAVGSLNVTVPQLYVKKRPRHYAPPQSWDSGLNAGFLSYNTNFDHARSDDQDTRNNYFLGLNGGLNLFGWRFRHNGSFLSGDNTDKGSTYQTLNNYLQRDLTSLSSQLTLGEHFTRGDLFDSIPFTGVQMESDERMLPDNERGFAPQVRGVAESNATVTIRQGNQVIHETTVPPGPFLIDDLYNTGFTENLEVTITEADGREKTFAVPYSYAAELLRPNSSRYFLTAGRYRGEEVRRELEFLQGGYRRGVTNTLTLYAGAIAADSYMAALIGSGFNTPLGAITTDITFADFEPNPNALGIDMPTRGQSYRLAYNKTFGHTGTTVQTVYSRSDEGYLGLSAAAGAVDTGLANLLRERDRLTLNVNQMLGSRSSLFLSGVAQSYWTGEPDNVTFGGGFTSSFSWGSLSLSASRFRSGDDYDVQYLATLSIPLGQTAGAPLLNTTATYQDNDNNTLQTSVSGVVGEQMQTNYNLYANSGLSTGERSNAYGVNLRHRTPVSTLGTSVSRGDGFARESLSARGSIATYSGGVVFSPTQGETMAIVEAEGAAGAQLRRNQVRIGGSGKALVTGLTPYRNNDIVLDSKDASDSVEIKENIQRIAPRYGAIVRVLYETTIGQPSLLDIAHADGQPIPFGAAVSDANGEIVTHVAQGQLVFIRTSQAPTTYRVSWGERESCSFTYAPPEEAHETYRKTPVTCSVEQDSP
ncbi:fimbria/pilus outer membrane usher protein [Zestomonas carbonaria]|uniref:Outer membrane usher protein HtrE n=1 Tax=Zestomonas carbonaria TaxID=2762745 RepID=A0A7U7EQG7_9GAMM|nr:fimbria/pilus outer membrane usher protein [Pseudomonas carbonaria]CAD5109323.1 Outer membrane usher protein HtrE [Pseudomonas carbonaria]